MTSLQTSKHGGDASETRITFPLSVNPDRVPRTSIQYLNNPSIQFLQDTTVASEFFPKC